jgi:glucose-1-phosphate thymidylyltransferase
MTTAVTAATKRAAGTAEKSGPDAGIKGLILSGGKGSRLRPFTYTSAKQLVPIANKPVLFYAIEQLVESGITDIGIVVGDTAEQVQTAAGDGTEFGASITYIRQEEPLGIAHGVKVSRDFLGGSRFVLYLGDNFVLGGIKPYVASFAAGDATLILLHSVENPGAFGIAELVGGSLRRVVEKPSAPASKLAVVGVYMFGSQVLDVVDALAPSARGELEITDAIQGLIDGQFPIRTETIDRYWIDTGKMDDMLNANRRVLATLPARCEGEIDATTTIEGDVIIERGAKVSNSTLRGPVIIGSNTQIVDSEIGPSTAVDRSCRLLKCRVADSIVMEGAEIEGIHWPIVRSMIGRYVELRGGKDGDAAHSLTLGDHSRIEVPDV